MNFEGWNSAASPPRLCVCGHTYRDHYECPGAPKTCNMCKCDCWDPDKEKSETTNDAD